MYLVFDTETTGLPRNYKAPLTDFDNWPRVIQIAWQLHDEKGHLVEAKSHLINPEGFDIPYESFKIHGISTEKAKKDGIALVDVLEEFQQAVDKSTYLVGHNIEFDINVMGCEYLRKDFEEKLTAKNIIDTVPETVDYVAIPGGKGGGFKYPKLEELHRKLFGHDFDSAHNAIADVEVTARCFFKAADLGVIKRDDMQLDPDIMSHLEDVKGSILAQLGSFDEPKEEVITTTPITPVEDHNLEDVKFSHLHVHTQFSVLQATSDIKQLIGKAKADGQPAIAMTDLGNMYGAFNFVSTALKNDIKPIVGCELYIAKDYKDKTVKDHSISQVLLAKNKQGYQNLSKLCSEAWVNGFYYVPRIDKELLKQNKSDLIALSGATTGEIPYLILNVGTTQAEEALKWWHGEFGDDFYIELNRHQLEEENHVNQVLLEFADKYNIKCIAANNTFYNEKDGAEAHDILLCVKDGEQKSTPIGRGRGFRWGMPNNEFYVKTQEEMKQLFADVPDAINNVQEVVDKVEPFELSRKPLLPEFKIPEEFADQDDYLRHITYEGAKKRYPEITDEIRERLDFELDIIKKTGYPGYFLIVQDFTSQARKMGVWVGPGRGSAAGSAVAYCIGITNIDPIHYGLLFERFLNPDRISMPDIDIDFDDVGRDKIINWVIEKYGQTQVAQIITYGTMAAKSAIRDTARVLDLPLPDADKLAKLMPPKSLNKVLDADDKKLKEMLNSDDVQKAKELKEIYEGSDLAAKTLQQAKILEGSVRNTGIHACGVIIAPDNLTKYVPVTTAKDSDLWVTQFDNSVVEDAGLLKMDFLGLKTLTILKTAMELVKERHGVNIDPDEIPLTDEKTYEMLQRGETVGIFQFESEGMQKHLRDLKPDKFGDLIAMNALYRPGPMQYIPNFIRRKHGLEEIEYPFPIMEEELKETYGITVYQEQVMLLSQKMAGFTKGQADTLRKAMGKKKIETMMELKEKFLDGAMERGLDKDTLLKIWSDWEAFAQYAFNKSHAACYAIVAFHTAYMKANYPAEFMAATLNSLNSIDDITFYMEECRRMGINVLGPDINESQLAFSVNPKGEIRFGMGAIKGVGDIAARDIIAERAENGTFNSIFDLTKRSNLKSVNKRVLESLSKAGAFDGFEGIYRAQYFHKEQGEDHTLIEKAIKYGATSQANDAASQGSLFGEGSAVTLSEPKIPYCEPWALLEKLDFEKEVVGMYLTGHPLDDYKFEVEYLCKNRVTELNDLEAVKGREMLLGGIVSGVTERVSKNGRPWGAFTLNDYSGSYEFRLFGNTYTDLRNYLINNSFLFIRAKVQTREWPKDSTELEVKIQKMESLSDIKEKMLRAIVLNLDINTVGEGIVEDLKPFLSKNEGTSFNVKVYDREQNMAVNLFSKQYKVIPNKEWLEFVKRKGYLMEVKWN
ncbi:MAG: DNA polymerase III subunit alpha [bacterium]